MTIQEPQPTGRRIRTVTSGNGFTLVELLIVVVILGILAAVVLPKFSNASATARASMLADNLRVLRMQIAVFRGQHLGVSAGYPDGDTGSAPTEDAFVAHLTMASTAGCDVAAPGTAGYDYGPYMREIPINSVNGKSTVQIVGNAEAFPGSADDSHGWIYQPSTCIFKVDSSGSDDAGRSYFSY